MSEIEDMPDVGRTAVCTRLPINYADGETITNVTLWYNAQKIVSIVMETPDGLSISKGPQLEQFTREEILIPDDEALIGFEGTQGSTQVYSLTPLTVKMDCWPKYVSKQEYQQQGFAQQTEETNEISNGAVAAILLLVWLFVVGIPFSIVMFQWYRGQKRISGQTIVPNTERGETCEGEEKRPVESVITTETEKGDGHLRNDLHKKQHAHNEEEE